MCDWQTLLVHDALSLRPDLSANRDATPTYLFLLLPSIRREDIRRAWVSTVSRGWHPQGDSFKVCGTCFEVSEPSIVRMALLRGMLVSLSLAGLHSIRLE